jgi:acetylornithine deacetylase/succinyl-diaminopimelate desuccinylase-like protein
MQSTELISTLQSHLNQNIAAPVHVGGTDERKVPVVLIEDWSITQVDIANTNYVDTEYNDTTGFATAEVYRIPYDCRVSFKIRHDDSVEASQLRDSLRLEIGKLEDRPSTIEGLSRAVLGDGGSVSYQFTSPTETEMTQSARFMSAIVYKNSELQNIEDITVDLIID